MTKKIICLICGENISMQIDLDELTISTDCKNDHHFRKIPFNTYYNLNMFFIAAFVKKTSN